MTDDHLWITPDWLASIGFEEVEENGMTFYGYGSINIRWLHSEPRLQIGGWWQYWPEPTRGNMRMLAKALGVALKEPPGP